jgi:signal peptidase II
VDATKGGTGRQNCPAAFWSGARLGNIIDRIAYGAVADFLNMSCCGIENPYAFNVADIAIFAGALGLVIFAKGTDTEKPTGGKPPRRKVAKHP